MARVPKVCSTVFKVGDQLIRSAWLRPPGSRSAARSAAITEERAALSLEKFRSKSRQGVDLIGIQRAEQRPGSPDQRMMSQCGRRSRQRKVRSRRAAAGVWRARALFDRQGTVTRSKLFGSVHDALVPSSVAPPLSTEADGDRAVRDAA